MNEENRWLTLALVVMGALLIFLYSVDITKGQEHRHPPQDAGLHHKFYSTWQMPDNRAVSCCHDEDCFPAQSKMVDGSWHARKDDSEDWVKIPRSKIEQDRDSPDGRSHLCGRKYGFSEGGFTVFCFLPASGS